MEGIIHIGAVNCAEDPHLCQSQNVRGYPSLIAYPDVRQCYVISENFIFSTLSSMATEKLTRLLSLLHQNCALS
jgi:hypothetical protein